VSCPTLVIAGSHDQLVPMGDTQKLLDAFSPGVARLRVIDGAGHNSVSDSAEFWQALVNGH
jgi:hypothetical protein